MNDAVGESPRSNGASRAPRMGGPDRPEFGCAQYGLAEAWFFREDDAVARNGSRRSSAYEFDPSPGFVPKPSAKMPESRP